MSWELSVQICPAPENLPDWAKIVQRPARSEDEGETMECSRCKGQGTLPKGDACLKCGGSGESRFIWCARLNFWTHDQDKLRECRELIPTLPADYRINKTVQLKEWGGGMTNTGRSTIVAGLDGKPLPSVAATPSCNGWHAMFWVHAALVIDYSHWRGTGSGKVSFVGIDRRAPAGVGVMEVGLWTWNDGEDIECVGHEWLRHNRDNPESRNIVFPEKAVEAAIRKAKTYHCRSAFYVASGGAKAPSGAKNRINPKVPLGY